MLQSGHSVTVITSASQVADSDLALGHFPPVPLPAVEFLSAKNYLLELTVSLNLTRKALARQIKCQEEAAKIFRKIP